MMLRVSLRPWAPRRPLRVWPARVTRRPLPARPAAVSTQSALRAGSSTCACTQPENGESLNTSLPAIRSGSAGPRSGRSGSTPSNVSRPRSRRPSMAAEKSSSLSSGTSIIRRRRAEDRLDRRAPARLLRGDVDQLRHERQLLDAEPARERDLGPQLVHAGRHPAGPVSIEARSPRARLPFAERNWRRSVASRRSAGRPAASRRASGGPLLERGELLRRSQRGVDVHRRHRSRPSAAAARSCSTARRGAGPPDHRLLLEREPQRLERSRPRRGAPPSPPRGRPAGPPRPTSSRQLVGGRRPRPRGWQRQRSRAAGDGCAAATAATGCRRPG